MFARSTLEQSRSKPANSIRHNIPSKKILSDIDYYTNTKNYLKQYFFFILKKYIIIKIIIIIKIFLLIKWNYENFLSKILFYLPKKKLIIK